MARVDSTFMVLVTFFAMAALQPPAIAQGGSTAGARPTPKAPARPTDSSAGGPSQSANDRDAGAGHPTDRAAGKISGGLPALRGITPSRAELPASAFTKLDADQRGYLTREDVSQLDRFDHAFSEADENGDGRLNASEFNKAWSVYSAVPR